MLCLLRKLWRDEDGFIVSTELILIATILVLGLVVGLTQVAAEVNEELGDVAAAISIISQSYSYGGISGHHAQALGSSFADTSDGTQDGVNCIATCSNVGISLTGEGTGS